MADTVFVVPHIPHPHHYLRTVVELNFGCNESQDRSSNSQVYPVVSRELILVQTLIPEVPACAVGEGAYTGPAYLKIEGNCFDTLGGGHFEVSFYASRRLRQNRHRKTPALSFVFALVHQVRELYLA